VTTIELKPITYEGVDERDDANEQRVVHLYSVFWVGAAACGYLGTDWHIGIHGKPIGWKRGMLSCPKCGAPICMDCLLRLT